MLEQQPEAEDQGDGRSLRGRPWIRRSAVVTSRTKSVASHTGRNPLRTPRARPHSASPATIDSDTVSGWMPKGSQWSTTWVEVTRHSAAKMTFSKPATSRTPAATSLTRRRTTHRLSPASSSGQVGPSGSDPTSVVVEVSTLLGARARRSRRTGDLTGNSLTHRWTWSTESATIST